MPLLSPESPPEWMQKALWLAGMALTGFAVVVVKKFAAGPDSLRESDEARARIDTRRLTTTPEWEKRLLRLWMRGERARLRETHGR